ncbi:MAG: Asp-tRNA(Asn)/Glu-tRNA(Gln) amidotransferase subunit GatB [Burkholderiales bacterium]
MNMAWQIVVGIETHAQLLTKSKIFSAAASAFGAPPNTHASALDIALPGTLPVLNRAALEHAIRFALAIGATINRRSIFARKNYFYPDLPKGYQISQYEAPIVQGGAIRIAAPDGEKTIRITRAHLEEDAGKSLHEDFRGMSGIDLNRAGTPLLEIVSEPDLRGAKEAVAYARALHDVVTWNEICDGNMEEGSFRCDANVSVRRIGDARLGTRCEIKNLNSFLFIEQAIEFESRRQVEILESGGQVVQETRLYDPDSGETRAMRTKEDAQDYRYFPDPDLLPVIVRDDMIERVRASMRKPRESERRELMDVYGFTPNLAESLTASPATASFALAVISGQPERGALNLANWITGPLKARLNRDKLDFRASKVSPAQLRELYGFVARGEISNSAATSVVLPALWEGEGSPEEIIERRGLKQISDAGAIEGLVDKVLASHAQQVADYRAGKEKAFNSLVGQVMKATGGKANPAQVNEILRRKLGR